jgi:putative membrane protein
VEYIVICVDRDDDLGVKTGLKGPIIGRVKCLEAASLLGQADPEESDTNTIFGGIRVFDMLTKQGYNTEMVLITGNPKVGLASDIAISEQLEKVLKKFKANRAVVVSDGAEDESVLPLINSRIKVDSVKRIIVRQSQNLESTWYIIRQLFRDPKVSRTFFIPIGLTLLILALFTIMGYSSGAIISITLVIGLYLLYRGMGLDEILGGFYAGLRESFAQGKLTFITYIGAFILIFIGVIQGLNGVYTFYLSSEGGGVAPSIIDTVAVFLNSSIWYFVLAGTFISTGWIVDAYIDRHNRFFRHLASPFFVIATGLLVWGGTEFVLITIEVSLIQISISIIGAMLLSYAGIALSRYMKRRKIFSTRRRKSSVGSGSQ